MRELTPREKLANLFANFKSGGADGMAGHRAGMAIDMLCEEVEKVENPYYLLSSTRAHEERRVAFNECRQKILSLLEDSR